VVFDVDGVLTDGTFFYDADGKKMKRFGADDHDALSVLKKHLNIRFISADRKGFEITEKRVLADMGFDLALVAAAERLDWISSIYPLAEVIYMGDGILDHLVMGEVGYAIAPKNANAVAKNYANYITARCGGDRAVAEACIHILLEFCPNFDSEIEFGLPAVVLKEIYRD